MSSCCQCTFISQRWIFAILASTGLCLQNTFSVIMSITIIEMVIPTYISQEENNKSCPSLNNVSPINNNFSIPKIEGNYTGIKRFSWDEYTQGIILSSFLWTSIISQFVYGTLAERFGGKYIFGFAILAQAILTFSTPFIVYSGGSTALIVTRVIIGLGSDGMFPVVTTMIPHWSTPAERTRIGNTIYSGSILGLFFGTIVPALVMKYSGMGWPAVFYFIGVVGMIWFPLWSALVYENPQKHPFIRERELDYLNISKEEKMKKSKLPSAPWKCILRCKEFWVFCILNIGGNSNYYVILSGLPRYMGNVVKFSIESNGYYSSLPYLLMWLNSMFSGWIYDKIVKKQWVSKTNMRKIFATIATTGPEIFVLLASYSECDKTMVVIMFMIGVTLIGCSYPSLIMNPTDLSPNYAGSIMSVGSGIAATIGMLVPYLIGLLVPNSTINEWRVVFWIVFSFAVVTNLIYVICFKAKVQPWDDPNFAKKNAQICMDEEEVVSNLMSHN